jgi:hypothetical protein
MMVAMASFLARRVSPQSTRLCPEEPNLSFHNPASAIAHVQAILNLFADRARDNHATKLSKLFQSAPMLTYSPEIVPHFRNHTAKELRRSRHLPGLRGEEDA